MSGVLKLRQARRREGGYLLRSNIKSDDPGYLWRLYLQLVEVEQAFKELKNDLSIRPTWRQAGEGEEPVAGFLQAVGDGFVFEPPLADEGLAVLFNLFAGFRVDHFVVVVGDLLMQALRGVGEEITMLVHRAPLHRHAIPNGGDRALEPRAAIDDEEIGPLQAAPDEIVEDRAPGLGALAAHLFDRQEHFLTVLANPQVPSGTWLELEAA